MDNTRRAMVFHVFCHVINMSFRLVKTWADFGDVGQQVPPDLHLSISFSVVIFSCLEIFCVLYPLVNVYITMENHHFIEFYSWENQPSMAISNGVFRKSCCPLSAPKNSTTALSCPEILQVAHCPAREISAWLQLSAGIFIHQHCLVVDLPLGG